MEKQTVNLDTSNEGYSFSDSEVETLKGLEGTALQEKVKELFETKSKKVLDTNRQLFARAKKAEGFEQNEEGDWVKAEKSKAEPKASKKSEKSDDELLNRLESMALKVAGLNADDEKELYNKWKDSTGREADEILGNKIFEAELADLRTAKANLAATSNIKGETGESGVKNTPDYWIAKATKGSDGKLLFSDEMPRAMYSKVLEKLASNTPGASEDLKFHNS